MPFSNQSLIYIFHIENGLNFHNLWLENWYSQIEMETSWFNEIGTDYQNSNPSYFFYRIFIREIDSFQPEIFRETNLSRISFSVEYYTTDSACL